VSDHRDQSIDRLLRQGAGAAPTPSTSLDCLDGEMLAAWSEHALAGAEAARIERHVADCARCQSMVALYARTAPLPARESEPWWRRLQVRWLVPIATAAIVATVWVALPEREPLAPAPAAAIQEAEPQRLETRSGGSTASTTSGAAGPAGASSPAREQSASDPSSSSSAARTPRASSPPPPAASKELLESRQLATQPAEQKASVDSARRNRAEAVAEFGTAVPQTPPRSTPEPRPAPSAPVPGALPPGTAATAPPPPPASTQARRAGETAAAPTPPPALAETVAVTADTATARRLTIANVVTRSGQQRWRIVGGTQLQRSTDGGVEWRATAFTPAAPLSAGHSPAPNVLWLVGQRGTIYSTTDGLTFELVPFVEAVDLVSVVATDARQATVRTADGRTLRTADRGVTWTVQ
jgi:hypothetical protein